MVRKSKMLRILFSTLLVLSVVLGLVGCGEQQSDQGDDNGAGSVATVDEEHGTTPAFEVDALTISPVQAVAGEEITVSTTVRNVGNAAGVYTAELLINQHAVETRDVTVASGGSQVLTFGVSRTEAGVYDVSLGGRSGSFTVTAPSTTAAFELSALAISPAEALSGEKVTISATIRNVGSADGVYGAELVVNGHAVETKDVTVPTAGSQVVTFTVSRTEAGIYDVALGERSGSFTVTTPTVAPVFQLDTLMITPSEAFSDDNISISTTVRNVGNAGGIYTAILVIDGHAIETRDVMVASGSSELLAFTASRTEPGIYDVAVGERSGSFTVSHPPLTLELDYIGVERTDPKGTSGEGNIRLLVLVSDGVLANGDPIWIPLELADPYPMKDYDTRQVSQQLFNTGSVGNYFKVVFIALRENPKPPSSVSFEEIVGALGTLIGFGNPEIGVAVGGAVGGAIGSLIDGFLASSPEYVQYTYVGSCQATWIPDQRWGIDQYDGVGDDGLRLWFRIWSGSESEEAAPPVLLPDVTIQDVTVPALVEVDKRFSYTVVLKNNEACPVKVRLSEITPYGYWATQVTIDAGGSEPVSHSVFPETARQLPIAFTVHKLNGAVVCQTVKTVESRDRFAGWYVGTTSVTTATVGRTVTARINMFNLAPGQYTMRVLRDVSWAHDEEVARVSFYYDGTPTTQDLSFVPLYANGYHLDLSRDGTTLWSQKNAFPPRLRVRV